MKAGFATQKEIAKYLRKSTRFVRDNEVPVHQVGGSLFYDIKEVNEWIRSHPGSRNKKVKSKW